MAPPQRPSGRGRTDRPDRPDRGRSDASRGRRDQREQQRPRVTEPPLADEIMAGDLDRGARAALRSLPDTLAERLARHLVAAGRALDDDPELACSHARYARSLAPRLAVVREAYGVASYATGDYATALAELRAARRMTGDVSYLPMMADCERGLGRPERALALVSDPGATALATPERVELAIVASGARRDLGEPHAAVLALQGPLLDREDVAPWTVRLWYAYAAALAEAGRTDDARRWFESVSAIDSEAETDAEERLNELG